MPRQIPLKRVRGDGGELDGCGEIYLKGIFTIIGIIVVLAFCELVFSAISHILPVFLIAICIMLVAIAIKNKSQFASWLVTIENHIEQWSDGHFVLVVAILVLIIVCLIFFITDFGHATLQQSYWFLRI